MQQPVFIRLENTFEAAMEYRNSPQMDFYHFAGVQLLPNNELPYIQRTYANGGIELEDYTVWITSSCGTRLQDITTGFEILSNFDDPNTGTPQLEWQLVNVPFDAGMQLVYLEIEQGANDTKYSSPFYLTNDESQFTERLDYGTDLLPKLYSTQLNIWFKQKKKLVEQETYDTVNTGNRTAVYTKAINYEAWNTNIIDYEVINLLLDVFKNKYVYVGLERTVMFEPFEIPDLEGFENFAEQQLFLCRDNSDKYDPLYIPPTPPTPPVDPPFINLIRVDSINDKIVSYVFTFGNFEPTYLTLQWSLDEIEWFSNTGGITSPREIQVLSNRTTAYKYRIYHEGTDTYSNVVSIAPPSITITNITSLQSSFIQNGNIYKMFYTLNGFGAGQPLSFEASFDGGSTWWPLSYSSGYQNPKTVTTPSSGLEFTKFRVLYNPMGIISNTFDFSF